MKNKFHQSFTILMSALILLGSSGFGLVGRGCVMRGEFVKLITEKGQSDPGAPATCCAKRKVVKQAKGNAYQETSCCKDNRSFEKLDVTSSLAQIQGKLFKAAQEGVLWPLTPFHFFSSEAKLPATGKYIHPISFSSRFYGRSMHAFIQSFVI